jgi:hypothetical protein
VDRANVGEVLKESFAARPKLVAINEEALRRGFEIGQAHTTAVAAG